MNLEFLKGDHCPICSTNIIIEESVDVDRYGQEPKVREHTHGGRWEKRQFICGQVLEYSPNFKRTEESKTFVCMNNQELIDKLKQREAAKENVLSYICELDEVDEVFKNRLHSQISSLYVGS